MNDPEKIVSELRSSSPYMRSRCAWTSGSGSIPTDSGTNGERAAECGGGSLLRRAGNRRSPRPRAAAGLGAVDRATCAFSAAAWRPLRRPSDLRALARSALVLHAVAEVDDSRADRAGLHEFEIDPALLPGEERRSAAD